MMAPGQWHISSVGELGKPPQGKTAIVALHEVGRLPLTAWRHRRLFLPAADLERWIDDFLAEGFQPRDQPGAADCASFHLGFDDACVGVHRHALPILMRLGLRATVYVVSGAIGGVSHWDPGGRLGQRKLMDIHQLREWLAAGQRIGAHTHTHPALVGLPADRLRSETTDSRRRLEDLLGIPVEDFAYPYGSVDAAAREAVSAAGFRTAVTLKGGCASLGDDPLLLPRVCPVVHLRSLATVVRLLLPSAGWK